MLLSFWSLSLLSSVRSFLSFPLLFLCLSSLFSCSVFVFSLRFPFFVPPLSVGNECGIYKAKGSGGRPYCHPIAVRGERRQPALPRRRARQPTGVGLQSTSLLIFHHEGMRGALGFRQKHAGKERQEEFKRKKKVFILPLLHIQRKKKKEQCRSKRHCFAPFLFLFFLKSMKRRDFGQNVLFYLNMAPTCQLPNQSLIYLLFISIASLQLQSPPL